MWIDGLGATQGTLRARLGWWAHHARSSNASWRIFTQRVGWKCLSALVTILWNIRKLMRPRWVCFSAANIFSFRDSRDARRAFPHSSAKVAPFAMFRICFLAGLTHAALRSHSTPKWVIFWVGESSDLSRLTNRPSEMQSFANLIVFQLQFVGQWTREASRQCIERLRFRALCVHRV